MRSAIGSLLISIATKSSHAAPDTTAAPTADAKRRRNALRKVPPAASSASLSARNEQPVEKARACREQTRGKVNGPRHGQQVVHRQRLVRAPSLVMASQ